MRSLVRPLCAGTAAALLAAGAHAAPAGRIVQFGLCDSGSGKENYAQPDSTAGYASRGNVICTVRLSPASSAILANPFSSRTGLGNGQPVSPT